MCESINFVEDGSYITYLKSNPLDLVLPIKTHIVHIELHKITYFTEIYNVCLDG
jgi:hypothetical protein